MHVPCTPVPPLPLVTLLYHPIWAVGRLDQLRYCKCSSGGGGRQAGSPSSHLLWAGRDHLGRTGRRKNLLTYSCCCCPGLSPAPCTAQLEQGRSSFCRQDSRNSSSGRKGRGKWEGRRWRGDRERGAFEHRGERKGGILTFFRDLKKSLAADLATWICPCIHFM